MVWCFDDSGGVRPAAPEKLVPARRPAAQPTTARHTAPLTSRLDGTATSRTRTELGSAPFTVGRAEARGGPNVAIGVQLKGYDKPVHSTVLYPRYMQCAGVSAPQDRHGFSTVASLAYSAGFSVLRVSKRFLHLTFYF
jgi:hypothetical protein